MRRAFKVLAWTLGAPLLLTITLCMVLYVGAHTAAGRTMIEGLILRLSAGQVRLSGLGGSFASRLTLERLQLSDEKGVWLTAQHLALRWTPRALWSRRVQIDGLRVARLYLAREPSTPHAGGEVSIAHIEVARFSIDSLDLGPRLAGHAASLAVSGALKLRSLQDAAADVIAHRLDGDGEYALHLRFDPARMDASLSLREPAGGPLENILRLPGLGALSATVRLNGPRTAERLDVVLDVGELQGRAHGTIDLVKRSAVAEYSLQAPAMAPRADLAWQSVRLRGRWGGSVMRPTADGCLQVQGLRLAGTEIAGLTAVVAAAAGKVALHGRIGGFTMPGSQGRIFQKDPVNIDATLRLTEAMRPLELLAAHRLFALHVQAFTGEPQSMTAELHLADLTPFAALAGQDLRGEASIKARLARSALGVKINLDATAGLASDNAGWSRLLGRRAELQLSGTLSDERILIERLRLAGRAVTLSLSGTASRPAAGSDREVQARWDLSIPNLGAISAELLGHLQMSGRLSGPDSALTSEAELISTLSVRGSRSGTVSASLRARGLPAKPSGTIRVHGILDGAPFKIEAALERNERGALRGFIRRADWKSAHVEGEVASEGRFSLSRGQLRLRVGQLGDLERLLALHVTGAVDGHVNFKPVGERIHAQLQFAGRKLTLGEIAADVQLTGEGATNALALRLEAQSPLLHGAPAKLASSAVLNLHARQLRITGGVANYRGQSLRLMGPATLSFANEVALDQLKLGADKAVLQLEGRLSPTFDVRASLRRVEPSLVNLWVPDLLSAGSIEAYATLQGSAAAPTGSIRVNAGGLRLGGEAANGLPAFDIQSLAQLMGGRASIDARIGAGSGSALKVSGRVPLTPDGAVDLKILGKVDVGLVNPLLEARGLRAAGGLVIDATLTGTRAAPQIGGLFTLAAGNIRDYGRGINLSQISARIEGVQGMLQIKSFEATAATGSVSMTGRIGLLVPAMPVDLQIVALNAQPIASNIVTANLDADIRLSGTARERLDVVGKINLHRTTIGIPSTLPPNVDVLDVRRRGHAAPLPAAQRLIIGIDVAILAPQEILVQGRGLDAELGGELHLRGTTDAPQVSGGFDLQRGSFSLAGSKLDFTAGRVTFDGAGLKKTIDPRLDFTAQTTLSNVTATLRITGLADAPRFEFTSSPMLPQDEIMARLLFGENAAQLTTIQAAQIGAALASLSGVGGNGLNPLGKLQKSLGLDRLSVGTSSAGTAARTGNSGASIAAGRYLSKRVYVEGKQSTTGSSQVQIDVDLSKHLKLQTRLGNGSAITQGTTPENDPGSSIGLSYQFEY